MNLSQLEALVAIAETGSFMEAADQVGLTRSAVSHALTNLEAELGVTLLERERGNATPTAIGNCILHHVRDILAKVETIQQEADAARGLQMGKLRIGVVSSISALMLSGILGKFRQEDLFEGSVGYYLLAIYLPTTDGALSLVAILLTGLDVSLGGIFNQSLQARAAAVVATRE